MDCGSTQSVELTIEEAVPHCEIRSPLSEVVSRWKEVDSRASAQTVTDFCSSVLVATRIAPAFFCAYSCENRGKVPCLKSGCQHVWRFATKMQVTRPGRCFEKTEVFWNLSQQLLTSSMHYICCCSNKDSWCQLDATCNSHVRKPGGQYTFSFKCCLSC